ncbi:hypothetical protein CDL15_Pgr017690 [Punica granatum]|uniref:Uncharacterized protein n=1 Tax=Punica granatum TaxID=22663 RepID=A0A218WX82_PUNGR|nr:hypothetical protein CDL15_Pgr017690 [Punica granatum]
MPTWASNGNSFSSSTDGPQLRNSLSSGSLFLFSPSRSPSPKPAARFSFFFLSSFSQTAAESLTSRPRTAARPLTLDPQLPSCPQLPARRLAARVLPFRSRFPVQR